MTGRSALKGPAVALSAAALATLLAACGSGSGLGAGKPGVLGGSGAKAAPKGVQAAAAALRLAGSQARRAGSARVHMDMSSPGQTGSIVYDGTMGWGAKGIIDGWYSGMPGAQSLAQPNGKVRTRGIGSVYYYGLPPAGVEKTGKHWVKVDTGALLRKEGGSDLSSGVENQTAQDPSADVAALASSGAIKDRGTERLAGQRVRHYTGTVPIEKVVEARTALTPAQRSAEIDAVRKAGFTDTSIDVWVNDKNLPVRLDQTMRGTTPIRVKADFSDYGVAIDTTPPPAADTVDSAASSGGSA